MDAKQTHSLSQKIILALAVQGLTLRDTIGVLSSCYFEMSVMFPQHRELIAQSARAVGDALDMVDDTSIRVAPELKVMANMVAEIVKVLCSAPPTVSNETKLESLFRTAVAMCDQDHDLISKIFRLSSNMLNEVNELDDRLKEEGHGREKTKQEPVT